MDEQYKQLSEEHKRLKSRLEQMEVLNRELIQRNEQLLDENKKNQELLSNVLALQDKDAKSKGSRFKMVTVLFSDIKGFTKLAEHMDAEALIDELDKFFFQFDEVVRKYNIEKIKSIGDSYMAAGGIPKKNRTNPIEVVMASLEMQFYMSNLQKAYEDENKKIWEVSIGIHTGPVVAEIIPGKKKTSYEIKGDTVNIASRIESSSEGGKINISSMTYELVRDYFRCEYRGKLPVKYSGDIDMYFVKGYRPEYSIEGKGFLPNERFWTKFALVQYDDLEEIILDKLEKELPSRLYYHNLKHTIDVINGVEVLGRGEKITEEELLLLKTAALFHDAGHIISSPGHEYHSCTIAREYLKKFTYTPEQIDMICDIIMATMLPPTPHTLLQQIICDADLDYLGRRDFIPVSDTLYKELHAQNLIGTLNDWNKMQVKFLTHHQFFTQTAMSLREVNKQLQIDRLRLLITED